MKQESSGEVREASGAARRAQEATKRGSEIREMSSTKITNLSSKVRLVPSERPKIAQIGSLPRWKKPRFPAIRKEEGFLELEAEPWGGQRP